MPYVTVRRTCGRRLEHSHFFACLKATLHCYSYWTAVLPDICCAMIKIYSLLSSAAIGLWVAMLSMIGALVILHNAEGCTFEVPSSGMDWPRFMRWLFYLATAVIGTCAAVLSTYWHERCWKIATARDIVVADIGDTQVALADVREPES